MILRNNNTEDKQMKRYKLLKITDKDQTNFQVGTYVCPSHR